LRSLKQPVIESSEYFIILLTLSSRLMSSLFKRLGAHPGTLLLVVAIGFGAAVVGWRLLFGGPVETYTATRGDLIQSVVASGQVITPERASIAAEVTGRVTRVAVAEGEHVRRDQILIELDTSDERAALAQAQAALVQAEAKVRQIAGYSLPAAEQALRQAQANLHQAQRAHERTRDLVNSNFLSRASLDDAQRNLDVAESQLRAAQLQVDSYRPGGSDAVLADAARREAEAGVHVAQAKLDNTIIRSPADGVLIARSVEPGDVAQAGKELLVLAPEGETQILVNIDEKNLGKLTLGQKALVSADAYPGDAFKAELFYVNPGIDPVRGAVEVKLRVADPPAYLKQDMTVSVDIEVARRDGVLIVPANAVHDATSPSPWVLVVQGGKAVKRPIKLGMRGDAAVEVVAGVAVGEAIVPATNGVVGVGQRIRATTARTTS